MNKYFAVGVCLVSLVLLAEAATRQLPAWQFFTRIQQVKIEPHRMTQRDDRYGLVATPGRYTIQMEPGYAFSATVGDDCLRITRPLDTASQAGNEIKNELLLFGCSFVWGWGVEDEETFAWVMQEELSDWNVVNLASFGYSGTINALFRLQDRLATADDSTVRVAILGHAAFHDVRNVLAPSWRFLVEGYTAETHMRDPILYTYFSLGVDGKLEQEQSKIGGRWSSLRHNSAIALAWQASRITPEEIGDGGTAWARPVTRALLKEFIATCQDANVMCLIAGMFNDQDTVSDLRYCKSLGAYTVDVSVDLTDPLYALPDGHPTPYAHRQFAEKLTAALRSRGILPEINALPHENSEMKLTPVPAGVL